MKISTAFDAFWFLHEHPKFQLREALLESEPESTRRKLDKGERFRTIRDEMPWLKDKRYVIRELMLRRQVIESNLSIFWTKVDGRGVVNDDKAKNVNVECWLEFGPMKQAVSDGRPHAMNYHDPSLDCGAPTFDQALVRLARLVRKHYGDIKTPRWL